MQTNSFRLDMIKLLLEKEGYQTSWIDPFKEWHRPDLYVGKSEVATGEILYVRDPPVSWIAPFDLARAAIRIDDEIIYFELSLYYVTLLEDQTEAAIINEIYSLHQYWHSDLVYFYSEVAERFSLKWDTEYDHYIEESLYGHLQYEELILNILTMLKSKDEERCLQMTWDSGDWTSDFPEIDCKLKKYRDCMDIAEHLERIYW